MSPQLTYQSSSFIDEHQNMNLLSMSAKRSDQFVRRFDESLCKEAILKILTTPEYKTSDLPILTGTSLLKEPGTLPQVVLKRKYGAVDKFISLQSWEGVVIKVEKKSFYARLFDLTRKGNEEEVELPLDEVSPGDRDLVSLGSAFYWSIGHLESKTGQISRKSMIRFKRLGKWLKTEKETAKIEAKKIREIIGWK